MFSFGLKSQIFVKLYNTSFLIGWMGTYVLYSVFANTSNSKFIELFAFEVNEIQRYFALELT